MDKVVIENPLNEEFIDCIVTKGIISGVITKDNIKAWNDTIKDLDKE